MSRQYYYLIASLPNLALGGTLPFSVGDLRGLLERQLSPGDFEAMRAVSLVRPEAAGPLPAALPELAAYYAWEAWARYAIAKARAARRGIPFARQAPDAAAAADYAREAESLAQAVFQAPDPLEGELVLERARWAFLDGIKARHFFDLEWLAAYILQLLALSRVAHFEPTAGKARFDETYEAVLGSANAVPESGVNE